MPTLNIYIRPADIKLFKQWKTLLAEQRRSLSWGIAEAAVAALKQSVNETQAERADPVAETADSSRKPARKGPETADGRGGVQKHSTRHGNRTGRKKEAKV